jgi:UDP-glucose 4-epimerase
MGSRETVVVIGGAGYIGSHVAKELSAKYDVIVYDNLFRGHRWAVQWGEFVEGDIRDTPKLTALFKDRSVKGVFHFAAHSLVGESVSEPLLYWDNNVSGTLSVLRAMKEASVNHIVFSSTAAVFGEPDIIPIDENVLHQPCNPYGYTKLTVESILAQCREAHGLSYCALRYFNAAGASPDGDIGEDHSPETHLIPLVLDAALGKRPAVSIYGDDYDTPDGTCVRDYIHVTDLAVAHVLAYEKIREDNSKLVLNLGNGSGFSVRQVIEEVKKVTGIEFTVNIAARRAGDPSTLIASSRKAIDCLGWSPLYPSLQDIVKTAWNWHKKHFS